MECQKNFRLASKKPLFSPLSTLGDWCFECTELKQNKNNQFLGTSLTFLTHLLDTWTAFVTLFYRPVILPKLIFICYIRSILAISFLFENDEKNWKSSFLEISIVVEHLHNFTISAHFLPGKYKRVGQRSNTKQNAGLFLFSPRLRKGQISQNRMHFLLM